MRVLEQPIQKDELLNSEIVFNGPMIKGVVDVERGIMAIDANMHADLEQVLLIDGSQQENLWGINLWPKDTAENFVEFDSMINIRPRQNNPSRSVEDPATQAKIINIVNQWIK